jgi:NADH-quinone oxidoreductase subunit C/D
VASNESARHDALVEAARSTFAESILDVDRSYDDLCLVVAKPVAHDVLAWLKNEHGFNLLLDIAGIDLLKIEDHTGERFEVEYILYAIGSDTRARVRVPVPESDLDVPTATDLWQSANWAERETWEMFGINFVGHPCLKRLLTHHEFEGYPLRKDYPVMGGQWCSTTSDLTDQLNEKQ